MLLDDGGPQWESATAGSPGPQQALPLALSSCPDRPFRVSLCLGKPVLPHGPACGFLTVSALGQQDKATVTTWPERPHPFCHLLSVRCQRSHPGSWGWESPYFHRAKQHSGRVSGKNAKATFRYKVPSHFS